MTTREQTRERIRAMERGERLQEPPCPRVGDETDLQRLLSPANLALLRTIREHEPESMCETADFVDRDFKEVHQNLTELETLNGIEFEQSGRSKRPIVRFDEIDIEVSLDASDTDAAAA